MPVTLYTIRARIAFCQWLPQQHAANVDFVSTVLFRDEASFTRNGSFNYHDPHDWAMEIPHIIRSLHDQQRFR